MKVAPTIKVPLKSYFSVSTEHPMRTLILMRKIIIY